jgi:hypothetical protein
MHEFGTVVVQITVNRSGNVIAAKYTKGTTNTNPCLVEPFGYSQKIQMATGLNAPETQIGFITVNFKLSNSTTLDFKYIEMNYQETTDWMFSQLPVPTSGASAYKDLTNTVLLLNHLDNPQKNYNAYAGTNGKGSTAHACLYSARSRDTK